MIKKSVPLLLIFFNRPNYSKKLIQNINKKKFKKIYIVVDGPRKKNLNDLIKINQIKKIIKDTNWNSNIKIKFRKKNYGCAINVYKSIKWFFKNENVGIILEDDCMPTKYFFEYMNINLIKYANDNKIAAVSGIDRRLFNLNKKRDQYLSKFFGAWGWGSWKKEIKNFKINIIKKSKDFERLHKWIGSKKVSKNLQMKAIKGLEKHDTWDYQISYFFLLKKKYIIRPTSNKIINIGKNNPSHSNHFSVKEIKSKDKFKNLSHSEYKLMDDLFYYLTEYKSFNIFYKYFKKVLEVK